MMLRRDVVKTAAAALVAVPVRSAAGPSAAWAAALAPPALKAIMPMSASDIRYSDDVHYIGGAR